MNWKTKRALLAASVILTAGIAHAGDVAENWQKNCVACHGADGKGATKAGMKAGCKDFTDAAYQAKLTDDKMADAIKNGLKEGGKTKMKAYGSILSDADIKALVAHVRGFKK